MQNIMKFHIRRSLKQKNKTFLQKLFRLKKENLLQAGKKIFLPEKLLIFGGHNIKIFARLFCPKISFVKDFFVIRELL